MSMMQKNYPRISSCVILPVRPVRCPWSLILFPTFLTTLPGFRGRSCAPVVISNLFRFVSKRDSMPKKMNLKELTKDEIHAFMSSSGLSRFRADQLIHWIYAKKVSDINEITEFSKGLRNSLRNRSYISGLKLERYLKSTDGTQKFLFSLEDGNTI